MIDHVSIGVRDIGRAKRFYDAALTPLGYQCLSQGEGSLGYGGGDPPPLKWSGLRYVFDIQEDCNGKEAIQA